VNLIKNVIHSWCCKRNGTRSQWYVAMVPRLFLYKNMQWARIGKCWEIAIVLTFPSSHLAMNWIGCSSKRLGELQFHIRISEAWSGPSFKKENPLFTGWLGADLVAIKVPMYYKFQRSTVRQSSNMSLTALFVRPDIKWKKEITSLRSTEQKCAHLRITINCSRSS